MLLEMKAWVNKKAGGLRRQFQIGNLAVVFAFGVHPVTRRRDVS
jgi:hypothetical protein